MTTVCNEEFWRQKVERKYGEKVAKAKRYIMTYSQQYWSIHKRITELYDIPEPEKQYNHNPVNDAYTITFEMQILYAIQDGRIMKKSNNIYWWIGIGICAVTVLGISYMRFGISIIDD